MKIKNILPIIALSVFTAWVAGCKEETKSVTQQTTDSANSATDAAGKAIASAKDAGAKVVADATDKAKELAAPASAKAQELIASAKTLVGEGKFQDALTKLQALGGEKLSVDQQAIVDGLKAQIQKALGATSKAATDAAGAAGGLIPK